MNEKKTPWWLVVGGGVRDPLPVKQRDHLVELLRRLENMLGQRPQDRGSVHLPPLFALAQQLVQAIRVQTSTPPPASRPADLSRGLVVTLIDDLQQRFDPAMGRRLPAPIRGCHSSVDFLEIARFGSGQAAVRSSRGFRRTAPSRRR